MTDDEVFAEIESALNVVPDNIDMTPDEVLSSKPGPPPSPTAFRHDRWSTRRGKEWSKSDVGGGVALKVTEEDERANIGADMLAAAWEPSPQFADSCLCEGRKQFLSQLMQTPEYKSLHRDTMLDDMASDIAAASFAKQWFTLVDERSEDGQPNPDGPVEDGDLDGEADMQNRIKQSIKQAKKEVQDLNDTRDALGIDKHAGKGQGENAGLSLAEVKRLFNEVKHNGRLRQIMDLSGRYLRLAQSMQNAKPCHGADDTVGVEFSGDLSRVMPSELALLTDEDLEDDFMRRFVENAVMCREVRSVENEARGPIVICVDESGSMCGQEIAHAKAMALAILWVAQHQNRWACLVGFSDGPTGNFLVVPPGKRNPSTLTEWLTHFYGGGTSAHVPLQTVPGKWVELGCPEGRTDIILITDACLDVPSDMESKFLAWKSLSQCQLHTIVIGDDVGDLERVSDRHWSIDELDVEDSAVQSCLSI